MFGFESTNCKANRINASQFLNRAETTIVYKKFEFGASIINCRVSFTFSRAFNFKGNYNIVLGNIYLSTTMITPGFFKVYVRI